MGACGWAGVMWKAASSESTGEAKWWFRKRVKRSWVGINSQVGSTSAKHVSDPMAKQPEGLNQQGQKAQCNARRQRQNSTVQIPKTNIEHRQRKRETRDESEDDRAYRTRRVACIHAAIDGRRESQPVPTRT